MSIAEGLTKTPCSEAAVASELDHLREVRTKLGECLAVLRGGDVGRTQMAMALSFVQMAIDALSKFQSERAALESR
jgi:hypothetical protein